VNSYDHDFPPMSIFPPDLRAALNGKAVEHAEAYFDVFIERLMKQLRPKAQVISAVHYVPSSAEEKVESPASADASDDYDFFLLHKRTRRRRMSPAAG
jgi:hypothetical protein